MILIYFIRLFQKAVKNLCVCDGVHTDYGRLNCVIGPCASVSNDSDIGCYAQWLKVPAPFLFDNAKEPFSASAGVAVLFFEKNKKQILDQPHITQLFLWSIGCAGSLLEPTTLRSFSFPKLVSAQFPSLTCSEHAMTCGIGETRAMEDRSWVHAAFSFAEGTNFVQKC